MSFHYKDIVPWGRSFDEYLDMFNLSEDDLARDIVDVGGGPARRSGLTPLRLLGRFETSPAACISSDS